MRSIYLVMHPEATHVVDRLVGGWYDSDLTSRGVEHAGKIAALLARRVDSTGTEVFSSDLLRARHTAQVISAALGVTSVLDPGLREQSYGVAEGRPVGTTPRVPLPAGGDRLRHHNGVADSETRLDVASRVYVALGRVIDNRAQNSVVVTHGGAATFVIAAWIGMPLESLASVKFAVSPGSVSLLRQDEPFAARQHVSLNELEHLR